MFSSRTENKYKTETNIGSEYFSGDYIDMINDIHSIVYKNLNATKGICVKADDANVEAVKNESKGEDVKGDGACKQHQQQQQQQSTYLRTRVAGDTSSSLNKRTGGE